MSNFAILNNNVVENIVIADEVEILQQFFPGYTILEISEETGGASIGVEYDSDNHKFIPVKPFGSWVFNEIAWAWDSPMEYPSDGLPYTWDEDSVSWIEVDVPVEEPSV